MAAVGSAPPIGVARPDFGRSMAEWCSLRAVICGDRTRGPEFGPIWRLPYLPIRPCSIESNGGTGGGAASRPFGLDRCHGETSRLTLRNRSGICRSMLHSILILLLVVLAAFAAVWRGIR